MNFPHYKDTPDDTIVNEFIPPRVHIFINDARNRDDELSDAVNRLIPLALETRHGILVTQHSPSVYTLEVHPPTPLGMIREKCLEGAEELTASVTGSADCVLDTQTRARQR
ncbi:hypothetical protein ACFRAU_07745 [Arthrobacter sp. NPDC056691]|uniref:hypothetical protein n=1 Tax=unclassified Arthrobacter TaxID=235627 RepID=UPI00366ADF3E